MISEDKGKNLFESDYYFKLGEAADEVRLEFQLGGVTDKAKASAKLLGKTAFNLCVFAGKLGAKVLRELPAEIEKRKK